MAEVSTSTQAVPSSVESGGYKQELNRTLGPFQVFAMAFAFISVAVAVFATYGSVLQSGGPVGIWLWIVCGIGQGLVALVYAQFAARIPLSGSSYQWASRLTNPKIGWGFGWLSFCYLGIAVVAADNALASTAFMPLFGIHADEGTARLLTIAFLVIQALVVVASTKLVGRINSTTVGIELGILALLTLSLIVAVVVTGGGKPENLFSQGVAAHSRDYFAIGGGLMTAFLMGLTTLVGFDSAANLAEEAKNPRRDVPRAIVGSVIAAAVLGFIFVVVLTISIKHIPEVTASDSPVAKIVRDQLGIGPEKAFLVGITAAFFGAGIAIMTACSRLIFAMSRDRRFPVYKVMRRVNPRTQTPIPATILVVLIGVVLMAALPGTALLKLIVASTILPAIIYGATICLYLIVRKRFDKEEGAFNLGRFELPVAIAALFWVLVALFALTVPGEAAVPDVIVVGMIAVGGVFELGLLIRDPKALETEPGQPDQAVPATSPP